MGDFKRGSDVIFKDGGAEKEATVVSYRAAHGEYKIRFKNGKESIVKATLVSANENAPKRERKTRSTSPGRSRSRGRPSNASRRSSSRGRKSPSPRRPTTTSRTRRSAPVTATPAEEAPKPKEKDEVDSKPLKVEEKKKEEKKPEPEKPGLTRRKSMRIAAIEADKPAAVLKPAPTKTLVVSEASKKSTASWLSILGALVCTVAIPISFLVINMLCDKKNCHFRYLSVPKRLATFYDKNAWLAYLGFALAQAILLLLPIGRRMEGPSTPHGRKYYRYNGWFSFLANFAAIAAFNHYGISVSIVRGKFFALMTAAWVFASVLSVIVYIKTRLRPGKSEYFRGQTGNVIVDWHAGRETIPRFGTYFDLKLYGLRLAVNGWVFMMAALTHLTYLKAGRDIPPQMIVCAAMGTFYALDFFFREQDYLTTFDYLKTGTGYAFFACAAMAPFFNSLPLRFLYDQYENVQLVKLSNPVLAGITLVYFVGYVIYVVANRMKNKFRRDPNSKEFQNYETIPTNRGKALILTAPWGWIRHPNYLGDIIIALAISATTGFGHFMPFAYPIALASFLILRARDDESRLYKKYGSSWSRYCTRVPYRFIPKVY